MEEQKTRSFAGAADRRALRFHVSNAASEPNRSDNHPAPALNLFSESSVCSTEISPNCLNLTNRVNILLVHSHERRWERLCKPSSYEMNDTKAEQLEELYRSESARLERIAVRKVGYGTGADVVQDTFVRLWGKALEQIVLTPAYLSRCVRNAAIDQLRSDKRSARLPELITEEQYAAPIPTPQQIIVAVDGLRHIDRVINQLPVRTRHIFVLNRLHDCTYDEIAVTLGISYSTVEREIAKALLACRAALDAVASD